MHSSLAKILEAILSRGCRGDSVGGVRLFQEGRGRVRGFHPLARPAPYPRFSLAREDRLARRVESGRAVEPSRTAWQRGNTRTSSQKPSENRPPQLMGSLSGAG